MTKKEVVVTTFMVTVVLIGLELIVLSFKYPNASGPANWLIEWTTWVTKYVALVVAAVGIVNVANSVNSRIRHGKVPK